MPRPVPDDWEYPEADIRTEEEPPLGPPPRLALASPSSSDVVVVSWPGGLDDQHDAAMWLFGERSESGARMGGVLPHARWSPLHDAWMVLQPDQTWRPLPDPEMCDLATGHLRRVRAVKRDRNGDPMLDEDGGVVVVPMRLTDAKVAGVLAFGRRHWGVRQKDGSSEWPSPPGVPFRGGLLLEPDGHTIRPIRASDAVAYLLPCGAPSDDTTPLLDAWARSAWGDDLWEECLSVYLRWLGATLLWEGASMHRALYLYGLAGRGKSVLLKVTEALFPPGLVAAVEPGAVGGFDFEPLARAQVNICDDITKAERWADGAFKTSVTGGLLRIDRKYRPQVNVRPRAGWIMAGNVPPDLRDPAVARRVVLLYFGGKAWAGRGASATGIDRELHERIVQSEGGAIVLRAVRAHVAGRGADIMTPAPFAGHVEAAMRLDPVASFVAEHLPADPDADPVRRSIVYQAYKEFCAVNGNKPLSSQNFAPALDAHEIATGERGGCVCVLGRRLVPVEREDQYPPDHINRPSLSDDW